MKRTFLTLLAVVLISAQPRAEAPDASLPRVDVIADYPATGLMSGCGNVYVTPTREVRPVSDAYIFLCASDGTNAWMNLNGRDTRLRHVRSWTSQEADPMERSYYSDYRAGETHIHVVSKPGADPAEGLSAVTITLQRGKARRVVRGLGSSDC